MARSPIFYTGKNNTLTNDELDAMTLNLKFWSGTSVPSSNNYELSKTYSINEVINFEVSDLIRSEFSHNFGVYNASFYEQSPVNEALWVNGTGQWTYSDNGAAPTTAPWATTTAFKFLTTQGWADKFNPTNPAVTTPVLALSRDRQVLSSNFESLAIYNSAANDLGFITITWNNGDSDTFYDTDGIASTPPDPVSGDTQDLVIYAGVGPANLDANIGLDAVVQPINHSEGDYYDVILKNTGGDEIARVRYTLICEPKYTPYQVSFVNRYGVADFITFFKRSDESGAFTNDQYKKSIYQDGFTSASLQNGQYQSFNVNSRNSIRLNTGWVDEDYADVIEDILMSEQVAIFLDGEWVAANAQRKSVDYQKEVNQKVITYEMTFDIAFNERTLIR
tara:strand:- start:282 stop:1457 length:1176 start_codon:yes stop_codon:yes gene_type:complete